MMFNALVQPLRLPSANDVDRRSAQRRPCNLEALSHAVDEQDSVCWGATVHDISAYGIGLRLCYPFRPGTYLAIELQISQPHRSLLGRVVHAAEQSDGTWLVGCEFVKPLEIDDLASVV